MNAFLAHVGTVAVLLGDACAQVMLPTLPTLTGATWIYNTTSATTSAPAGTMAFRRTFTLAAGKTTASVMAVMTADNLFTLWIGGSQVGSSPNDANAWKTAQVYSIPLNSTAGNLVFAVLTTNLADDNPSQNAAGLLGAINILYTDGSLDSLTTDTAWKVNADPADGWQATNFDDSSWAAAANEGTYGVQAWGTGIAVPVSPPTTPTLMGATWIYNTASASTAAPVGTMAFRRTFTLAAGKTADIAVVIITADKLFTLWIDNSEIGSSPNDANA
ncbi:hypothetical protein MVEN_02333900 [Mycena venus]|uniref:Uncharacterized protein n=1 Tax=Mycena venus TaxID=2733690 RepID=A0A8H6X415_9AGAR|nr:hypothetical protein MVEN_02333900 [Mycena venus]